MWDGRILTVSNSVLSGLVLVNISRSQPMYDTHSLVVSLNTTREVIDQLWVRLQAALRTMPNDFNVARSTMALQTITQQTSMQLDFYIAHCTNWSKAQQIARRHFVISALRDHTLALGIVFANPLTPYTVVKSAEPLISELGTGLPFSSTTKL